MILNKKKIYQVLLLCLALQPFGWRTAIAQDRFKQEYAIKYYTHDRKTNNAKVLSDRNGRIQFLQAGRLLMPFDGKLLFPGRLSADITYRYDSLETFRDIILYQNNFVYLTNQLVYSNAWAGTCLFKHHLPKAKFLEMDETGNVFLTDGQQIRCYAMDGKVLANARVDDKIKAVHYDTRNQLFWMLSNQALYNYSLQNKQVHTVYRGSDFSCFTLNETGKLLVLAKSDRYSLFSIEKSTDGQVRMIQQRNWDDRLPAQPVNTVQYVDGTLWFGSMHGAFRQQENGAFDYYQSGRWLPGDTVYSLAKGPESTVLIATNKGLARLHHKAMSLEEKAAYYDKQVRERHIRYGLNATLKGLKEGNLRTGILSDSDNDGLWTSMYLAAEAFRYATTKDSDALLNCRESLLAMERLYSVNPLKGFPSRSFERIGHKTDLADSKVWLDAPDGRWSWKSTTSSDEAIGHLFVFSVLAEVVNDPWVKEKAITLMDSLMSHIVANDLYLVDHDGKPTLWGKWNPAYVNQFPTNIGDRKLNSSNIISMLQSAYYFTKKEKYRDKAWELMDRHGYYENLMRPMKGIGQADEKADDYSKMLSERWNHSDDEMYFLGYWGLYRYALNDTLKNNFRKAILDHWEFERPEKDALWNFFAAMVGEKNFDRDASLWFLREFPLDLINWQVTNSVRKDIRHLEENFMNQSTDAVLSPKERPVHRHNRTTFILDEDSNGTEEFSAGDIWLLPYWLGRYLEVVK